MKQNNELTIFEDTQKKAMERFNTDRPTFESEMGFLNLAVKNSNVKDMTDLDLVRFYLRLKEYNLPFNISGLYYIYNGIYGKPHLEISYHGLKHILATSHIVVDCKLVRKEDDFEVLYDDAGTQIIGVRHKVANWFDTSMKNVIGGYCHAMFKNGKHVVIGYSIEDLNRSRKSAKTDKIWALYEVVMYLKSILRQSFMLLMLDGNNTIPEGLPLNQVASDDNENYNIKITEKRSPQNQPTTTQEVEILQVENTPAILVDYDCLLDVASNGNKEALLADSKWESQSEENQHKLMAICEEIGSIE